MRETYVWAQAGFLPIKDRSKKSSTRFSCFFRYEATTLIIRLLSNMLVSLASFEGTVE